MSTCTCTPTHRGWCCKTTEEILGDSKVAPKPKIDSNAVTAHKGKSAEYKFTGQVTGNLAPPDPVHTIASANALLGSNASACTCPPDKLSSGLGCPVHDAVFSGGSFVITPSGSGPIYLTDSSVLGGNLTTGGWYASEAPGTSINITNPAPALSAKMLGASRLSLTGVASNIDVAHAWLKHRGYKSFEVVVGNRMCTRFRKGKENEEGTGPVFTVGPGWTLVDVGDGEVVPEFTAWPEEGLGELAICCPHCSGHKHL